MSSGLRLIQDYVLFQNGIFSLTSVSDFNNVLVILWFADFHEWRLSRRDRRHIGISWRWRHSRHVGLLGQRDCHALWVVVEAAWARGVGQYARMPWRRFHDVKAARPGGGAVAAVSSHSAGLVFILLLLEEGGLDVAAAAQLGGARAWTSVRPRNSWFRSINTRLTLACHKEFLVEKGIIKSPNLWFAFAAFPLSVSTKVCLMKKSLHIEISQ